MNKLDKTTLACALVTFSVCMGVLAVASGGRLRHDNPGQWLLMGTFLWTVTMGGFVSSLLDMARRLPVPEKETL